jgi:N6-L-threonylcarbamoyladenine synthase
MKIFAIETSCDETAAAIVENGVTLISEVVASSKDFHERTGGVVPEIAARKQVEAIVPVISETISKSGLKMEDMDAFAVTVGPGLIGSLVVGVAAAKALAFVYKKPLIPVNHLVGHIYANWLGADVIDAHEVGSDFKAPTKAKAMPEFPSLALVISGGHTDLVLMKNHGDLEYLGGTLDDAAGEAFDKTARLLGLKKYLGGAELSKLASLCEDNLLQGKLPRPKIRDDDYDFSFSGLKSAVKRLVNELQVESASNKADLFNRSPNIELEVMFGNNLAESIAKEFETAVTDVVCAKVVKAAKDFGVRSVLIGGGVAANKTLRVSLEKEVSRLGPKFFVPEFKYCTDNAVYIASAAYFYNKPILLDKIEANPALDILGS